MTTCTLSMHCYEGDKDSLYANLDKIVKSHKYDFDEILINHQRCEMKGLLPDKLADKVKRLYIPEMLYPTLLKLFKIPVNDERADELTHGPKSPHYWKNHVVNHLSGLACAESEYVVFSDSDCIMVNQPPDISWVEEGIKILSSRPEILIISPSEGSPGLTQIMSQQLFLCNRKRLMDIDWNCWDGKFIDGGPMQEYYPMLEGRIGMYLLQENLHRLVLPDSFRYYHDPIHHPPTDEFKEALKGWK